MDYEDSARVQLLLECSVPSVPCVPGSQGKCPPFQIATAFRLLDQPTEQKTGDSRDRYGGYEYIERYRRRVVRPGSCAADIFIDVTGPPGQCKERLDDHGVEESAENRLQVSA